uniref:Uncharacterized protein n=1 Tax=Anguilla anguilla TaxID=7936 RepID=A0A0E9PTN4_ANGAN
MSLGIQSLGVCYTTYTKSVNSR